MSRHFRACFTFLVDDHLGDLMMVWRRLVLVDELRISGYLVHCLLLLFMVPTRRIVQGGLTQLSSIRLGSGLVMFAVSYEI
jgi:hypothetical protein